MGGNYRGEGGKNTQDIASMCGGKKIEVVDELIRYCVRMESVCVCAFMCICVHLYCRSRCGYGYGCMCACICA